ncbi:MAG TPA: DUF1501 domain-containing protein [Terriglobia bacterium]|nr:DUF1501 domain-containing protein [Terriglobia bacterium]
MPLTRRYFLKSAGLSLFGVGFVPSFMRRTAFALPQIGTGASKKILVAIFQRGAADGLNIVVPYAEKEYYSMRPTIAIPAPRGTTNAGEAAIDLDGFFGFHPGLASLKPLFDDRSLAVIHAVGSPDNTRSHFDAQDYMESGAPGIKSAADGWLNRFLQAQPEGDATPFRAVAITPRMPRTLQGAAPALAIEDVRGFKLRGGPPPAVANPHAPTSGLDQAIESMYASASDPLMNGTAHEMLGAVSTLRQIGVEDYVPENGAVYPKGPLSHSLQQVAQLIKAGVGLEIAFAEVGGWDNHVNEGGVEGQLAARLKEFGDSLAAFHRDMGDRMANICVLTMTEFGRTAHENGNRGTDHGHANAMFALGGPVKGGKVYGQWPGLRPEQLNEGRDLALTTDFRDVFAEVLVRHMGATNASGIFPGFSISAQRFKGYLG